VPGPDHFALLPAFGALLYGPAPGVELIPYFLGLLAWAGVAVGAVLLSPILALLRRLRRGRGTPPAQTPSEPMTASVPESSDDGSRDPG
jgi:hypothetical protein